MANAGRASYPLLLLACALAGASALQAGILDEVRSSVRESESSSSDDASSHGGSGGYGGGCCDDDCDPASDFMGHLCGLLLEQLFTQHSGDAEPSPALSDYYFRRFPYDKDGTGYLISEASLWEDAPPPPMTAAQLAEGAEPLPPVQPRNLPPMRPAAIRLWFDYGNDFDDLERWRGGILLQTCHGPAFEAEWNTYVERLPAGIDQLHVGEANALFRIYASERVQWMWGGGLAWLDDPIATNFGYNLTLKTDFFPVKPWVFSTDFDYGEIGRAHVFHAAATIGVLYRRYEIFGGYDYRNIESTELQGPMFGVRLWY